MIIKISTLIIVFAFGMLAANTWHNHINVKYNQQNISVTSGEGTWTKLLDVKDHPHLKYDEDAQEYYVFTKIGKFKLVLEEVI